MDNCLRLLASEMPPMCPAASPLGLLRIHLTGRDSLVVDMWVLPSETSSTPRLVPRRLSLMLIHPGRWDSVVECWHRLLVFRTFITHLADPRHSSLV